MIEEEKSLLDRILFGPWLLAGLLLLLARLWWSLPFDSLDDRLGESIRNLGWDAGPPGEYPYDFVLFWHLALSALVYCVIFSRLQFHARRQAGPFQLADYLPVRAMQFLFLYPLLSIAIFWVYPWNDSNEAQKVVSLMIYPLFFCSLTLLALGSLGRPIPLLLIQAICLLEAGCSFIDPIYGRGQGFVCTLGLTAAVTIWALAKKKPFRARLRSAYPGSGS